MLGSAEEIIKFLFEQDREKIWEIKEYKSKRSLNQNAYFYKLIGEIADLLKVSKTEIHLKMLKEYGQSEIISVLSGGLSLLYIVNSLPILSLFQILRRNRKGNGKR